MYTNTEKTEYRCAQCGGEFKTAWSDDDAQRESEQLWGRRGDTPGMALVCDDCFNEITRRVGAERGK